MLRFVIGVPGALVIALPSAAAVQPFPAWIAAFAPSSRPSDKQIVQANHDRYGRMARPSPGSGYPAEHKETDKR
jgi:hypothetical protein